MLPLRKSSSGNGGSENWGPGSSDQAIWATEDDYGMWSGDTNSNPNYEGMPSQARSGSEPPSKRSKSGDLMSSNRSKAIGKMFYKTKLCCKFRAGTCPYVTNCNFAHNIEELRKPPPNWQEIVAAHEEDRPASSEPREEFQIPIVGATEETQRSNKGRHCKKFYTEEGCPYGENCTFLHDEQSKTRESFAISLGPGSGASGYGNNANSVALKPSNWKTRICNKWELTGYCPFGSKCHFAHGAAELHNHGGLDSEVKDASTQGEVATKTSVDSVLASVTSVPYSNAYHLGVPAQRLPNVVQKTGGHRPTQKWKGPDKISKIYGDWIDDL
ncbi:zinc finger CCCH domain-containing protein 56-like isoform X2 [Salvia hispanica]|uniref:zinc finger CCCH domain-containing protein 56-like isoform X2 n=1 Tax=Salvia hispanica TaxID=49212 RepID=UPI002009069C|nr:zinc finger CCCH domain-containing protein 56-like isoform X2 [Salvia hispanica]